MNETEAVSNNEATAEYRTDEEVAWDKEFQDDKEMSFPAAIADMLKLAVKVPAAILQMPLSLIPEETAQHTRAALRETFLAFRSALGAIGDGIEHFLADPQPTAGPDGTWGRGPATQPQSATTSTEAKTSGVKSKRIALSDEQDEPQPSEGTAETDSSSEGEDEEAAETRGLRADIDY